MKHIVLLFIAALLASCVDNPSVTVTSLDGTTMRLKMGRNLMAEVDEQVSELEAPGYHLRHMVKRQDATRVPIATLQTLGFAVAGWTQASVTKAKEITSQLAAGEITKRQAAAGLKEIQLAELAAKSGTTSEAIKAGAEITPITVNPP